MNPELLERLRALLAAPSDATRVAPPQLPTVPTMRAQMANAMPTAQEPSTARKVVSVAQEFVPGLAEGMGARRAVEDMLAGRQGRAALEGAGVLAGALPIVGDIRGAARARKGIQAYHGSPFKFQKFSDEFMGRGEGAQARGAGHYLGTSKESIVDEYKKGRDTFLMNENVVREMDVPSTPEGAEAFAALRAVRQAARQLLTEEAERLPGGRPARLLGNSRDRLAELARTDEAYARASELAEREAGRLAAKNTPTDVDVEKVLQFLRNRSVRENPGFLYEVNAQVNPQRFLNYNATLFEQPRFTQRALQTTRTPELVEALEYIERGLTGRYKFPVGRNVVDALEAVTGSKQAARGVLAEQGIEFTQHTPYGNRGKHLIVYDPERIRIQNILAALGLMAGGGAMAKAPDTPDTP